MRAFDRMIDEWRKGVAAYRIRTSERSTVAKRHDRRSH